LNLLISIPIRLPGMFAILVGILLRILRILLLGKFLLPAPTQVLYPVATPETLGAKLEVNRGVEQRLIQILPQRELVFAKISVHDP
jgi:hypothetical protein